MELKATVSYTDHTPEVNSALAEAIRRAVGRSILVMERNIKVFTPVVTGHLRRSIYSKQVSPSEGEVRTAAVEGGKEIDYAVYVEYGTRHMAPRAMFRKGAQASDQQIKAIFRDEAKKAAEG